MNENFRDFADIFINIGGAKTLISQAYNKINNYLQDTDDNEDFGEEANAFIQEIFDLVKQVDDNLTI